MAERSATAAAEISLLSKSGVSTAEGAGEMLLRLAPDIRKTAELVQEVNASNSEQSTGVGQINKALQELDHVIQQNASAAEEMASTSEELSSQAQQLQSAISFFKLGNNSGSAQRASPLNPHSAPAKTTRSNGTFHATPAKSKAGHAGNGKADAKLARPDPAESRWPSAKRPKTWNSKNLPANPLANFAFLARSPSVVWALAKDAKNSKVVWRIEDGASRRDAAIGHIDFSAKQSFHAVQKTHEVRESAIWRQFYEKIHVTGVVIVTPRDRTDDPDVRRAMLCGDGEDGVALLCEYLASAHEAKLTRLSLLGEKNGDFSWVIAWEG